MSSSDESNRCTYVLRCGKNKGGRCTNRVSKKCLEETHCWTHIPRVKAPVEKAIKVEPVPIVVDEEKAPNRESSYEREKRWEERYMREEDDDLIPDEVKYMLWKNQRMFMGPLGANEIKTPRLVDVWNHIKEREKKRLWEQGVYVDEEKEEIEEKKIEEQVAEEVRNLEQMLKRPLLDVEVEQQRVIVKNQAREQRWLERYFREENDESIPEEVRYTFWKNHRMNIVGRP